MATTTGSKRLLNISSEAMAASNSMTYGGLNVATEQYVSTQVSNLVASAPGTLDTLNELAAALGDDPNFATTITNSIATKLDASVNPIKAASVSNDTITFTRADNTTFSVTTSDANTNYYLNGITRSGNTLTFSVSGATNQTYTFGSAAWSATTAFDAAGAANEVHDRIDNEIIPLINGKADASHTHAYLPLAGGTITGSLTVSGSETRGTYDSASQYHTGADNIVLKGNASGISSIFFESEKNGTNINHPSDFGFIQYHPYGTSTSGESNELIIGVSNDADDHLVLNAPNVNGLKFRTGATATDYTVYHSGNLTLATLGYTGATNANYITNNNQLTNGAGYITGVAWNDITSKPSTFAPSAHTHAISEVDGLQAELDAKQAAGSYAASNHNHTYDVNNAWLRDNGDNANVKLYGNSRQMVFRTDGTAEYASGVGGYAFTWMYGGDAAGNRRMLLASDGRLWTSYHGWLDTAFASASHNHDSSYDAAGTAAAEAGAVNDRIDNEIIPFISTKQDAGTYNTVIGTDSDINTGGYTVIDQLNMTDGVIQSHSTRSISNLYAVDSRAAEIVPNDYLDNSLSVEFTDEFGSLGAWYSGITLKGWSDGYAAWQLIGGSNTSVNQSWYLRSGVGTTWSTMNRIWHSGDFSSTNVTNWNSAYNNYITGIAVTGTTTKTITLTQRDGGTISGSFTDLSGAGGDGNDFLINGTWDEGSETLSLEVANQGQVDIVLTNTMRDTDTNTWRPIDDTPVNGATTTSISSNWAFDNVKTAVPSGAVFTDTKDWDSITGKPTSFTPSAHTHVAANITDAGDIFVKGIVDVSVSNDTFTFTTNAGTSFTRSISDANTNYYLNGITRSGNVLTFSVNGTTNQTYTFGSAAWAATTDFAASSHTHTPSQVGLGNLSANGNNLTGNFVATGDITAFSDARVKENVETISNALESVNQMRGVTYNKIGEEKESVGVIAQEIQEVMPQLVAENEDGMLSVAYGNITAVLIEAVKELTAKVESLEEQLKNK